MRSISFIGLLIMVLLWGCPQASVIKKNLYEFASFNEKGDVGAIRVPVGKIFILEQNGEYGAVKIVSENNRNNDVNYICYYGNIDSKGKMILSGENTSEGKLYTRTKKQIICGEYVDAVDGKNSNTSLRFGPFSFGWSCSNWIYISGPPRLSIALTKCTDIKEVNFYSKNINWIDNEIMFKEEERLDLSNGTKEFHPKPRSPPPSSP